MCGCANLGAESVFILQSQLMGVKGQFLPTQLYVEAPVMLGSQAGTHRQADEREGGQMTSKREGRWQADG